MRRETGLSEGAVSVSYAAIALARKIFGDLTGLNVLILGAGEMAKLTGTHLKAQQVRQHHHRQPDAAHAAQTARAAARRPARCPGPTLDRGARARRHRRHRHRRRRAGADARAVSTTVMRPRRSRPLFIIDIAVPRDVEPAVGDLEQVFLYNIDDLQAIVQGEPGAASERAGAGRSDRRRGGREVRAWLQSRDVIPTVVALRAAVRGDPAGGAASGSSRSWRRLPPEARARVDEITQLIVEKLLLTPTEQLKAVRRRDAWSRPTADALNRLFGLGADEPAAEAPRTARDVADPPAT